MTGLIDIAPYGGITLREQGTDVIAASSGDVLAAQFGSGMAANLTPRLFRAARRNVAETGVVGDEFGTTVEPETQVDPKTLNEQFGIPGHLTFDRPLAESAARDLYEHKRAELVRQDIIERRAGGVATGAVARMGTGLLAGLLDPLNLAVGLVPIVGEVRAASLLGRGAIETMGAAERAGVRAVAGGVSGGAAMAALQPVEYGLSLSERDDFTMADALRNIAFGAALGGGLHVVGGAIADRVTGRYANPITQRVEDAGPEARAELLQGAVARHVADEPMNVASALDLADAIRVESGLVREPPRISTTAMDIGGQRYTISPNPGGGFDIDAGPIGILYANTHEAAVNQVRLLASNPRAAVQPPELQVPTGPVIEGEYTRMPEATPAIADFRQRQAQAIDELAPHPEPASDTAIAADQATRATETLSDIERQIAELETSQEMPASSRPVAAGERAPTEAPVAPPGETRAPAAPERPAELLAADAEVEAANARAAAYERAATCIIGGG